MRPKMRRVAGVWAVMDQSGWRVEHEWSGDLDVTVELPVIRRRFAGDGIELSITHENRKALRATIAATREEYEP